jgi:hypothetical protein
MHVIHHAPGFMQTRNFNLTFPLCDALFGTGDLDRGLIATLFNGSSHRYMRKDLRPEDVDVSIPQVSDPAAAGRPTTYQRG